MVDVIRIETESKWRRRARIALRASAELLAMVVVAWIFYVCWQALRSMRP